LQCFFVLDHFF